VWGLFVVLPSLISLINNIIIFKYVRSSSKRIQPTLSHNWLCSHQTISRRDLHLIRHMIFMFCLFVVGWSPVCIHSIIVAKIDYHDTTLLILALLAESSLLCCIVNLYVYNHDLRHHLKTQILKCSKF
jgi:hypothetical protein